MSRVRITFVITDDADIDLIADAVVERAGRIAVVDLDDTELPPLLDAGLFVQNVTPSTGRPPPVEVPLTPPPADVELESLAGAPVAAVVEPAPSEQDVHVVDLDAPLLPGRLDELQSHGIELVERVGPTAATVRLVDGDSRPLDELPWVREHRRYGVSDTINPALAIASPLEVAPEPIVFDALAHDSSGTAEILAWLTARSVEVRGSSSRKVRFVTERGSSLLSELAAVPQVRQIDEYIEPSLSNDRTRQLIGIDAPDGTATVPWTGTGQVVGVADSGIDQSHPDFAGRIRTVIARGRDGDGSDPVGHGTHVAGSIGGSGARIRGIAPGCEFVVQSLLRANGQLALPIDLGELFTEAREAGVHIHNNSWGSLARSAYRMTALELDEWAWANPDMLIVVAAGNDATAAANMNAQKGFVDLLSINAPATAKNALTVGASRTDRAVQPPRTWREYRPALFPDDPIGGDTIAGGAESLAAFSGRGPCDELLRLKPDVVAPGTFILSTRSSSAPDDAFWQPYNARYAYLGGTSMAAPMVSGLAALIRQYYLEQRNHEPSAALLKATLVCGARWLTGADSTADHPTEPNFHQGFGRVDLPSTLPIAGLVGSPSRLAFADTWRSPHQQLQTTGNARTYQVKVAGGPLRICLVWTDPPGRGVQNSTALTVRLDSHRWAGNERRPPTPIKSVDSANNVQVVRIPDAAPGVYQIQVTATNLLRSPHAFALVVTGDLSTDLIAQP